VAPRIVVHDAALTRSLPATVSAASGMNAIAHAVEAMYAVDGDLLGRAAAEQAIASLAGTLPQVVAHPDDLDARAVALRGARLAGIALQHASMGLHHKICHVLGGTFGLPHAETHAAILPAVVAFNAAAAPEAMARVARALGASDAAEGLRSLTAQLGLTMSLGKLGLGAGDVDRAAALVAAASYPNPRPVTADNVGALLRATL
jgi:maleylacetate reductase